jgi:hypothetical protein
MQPYNIIIRTTTITLARVTAESESAARQCFIDGDYESLITTSSDHLVRVDPFIDPSLTKAP